MAVYLPMPVLCATTTLTVRLAIQYSDRSVVQIHDEARTVRDARVTGRETALNTKVTVQSFADASATPDVRHYAWDYIVQKFSADRVSGAFPYLGGVIAVPGRLSHQELVARETRGLTKYAATMEELDFCTQQTNVPGNEAVWLPRKRQRRNNHLFLPSAVAADPATLLDGREALVIAKRQVALHRSLALEDGCSIPSGKLPHRRKANGETAPGNPWVLDQSMVDDAEKALELRRRRLIFIDPAFLLRHQFAHVKEPLSDIAELPEPSSPAPPATPVRHISATSRPIATPIPPSSRTPVATPPSEFPSIRVAEPGTPAPLLLTPFSEFTLDVQVKRTPESFTESECHSLSETLIDETSPVLSDSVCRSLFGTPTTATKEASSWEQVSSHIPNPFSSTLRGAIQETPGKTWIMVKDKLLKVHTPETSNVGGSMMDVSVADLSQKVAPHGEPGFKKVALQGKPSLLALPGTPGTPIAEAPKARTGFVDESPQLARHPTAELQRAALSGESDLLAPPITSTTPVSASTVAQAAPAAASTSPRLRPLHPLRHTPHRKSRLSIVFNASDDSEDEMKLGEQKSSCTPQLVHSSVSGSVLREIHSICGAMLHEIDANEGTSMLSPLSTNLAIETPGNSSPLEVVQAQPISPVLEAASQSTPSRCALRDITEVANSKPVNLDVQIEDQGKRSPLGDNDPCSQQPSGYTRHLPENGKQRRILRSRKLGADPAVSQSIRRASFNAASSDEKHMTDDASDQEANTTSHHDSTNIDEKQTADNITDGNQHLSSEQPTTTSLEPIAAIAPCHITKKAAGVDDEQPESDDKQIANVHKRSKPAINSGLAAVQVETKQNTKHNKLGSVSARAKLRQLQKSKGSKGKETVLDDDDDIVATQPENDKPKADPAAKAVKFAQIDEPAESDSESNKPVPLKMRTRQAKAKMSGPEHNQDSQASLHDDSVVGNTRAVAKACSKAEGVSKARGATKATPKSSASKTKTIKPAVKSNKEGTSKSNGSRATIPSTKINKGHTGTRESETSKSDSDTPLPTTRRSSRSISLSTGAKVAAKPAAVAPPNGLRRGRSAGKLE